MNTTCDCSCIARQNAGNRGMLPQTAQTALLQTGRRASITEIKKQASFHIDCSNRTVFP